MAIRTTLTIQLPHANQYAEPDPAFLFHWAYKVSDIRSDAAALSPDETKDLSVFREYILQQPIGDTEVSKLTFRMFIFQALTWILCLPHLSMDSTGIDIARSITQSYVDLLDQLVSLNYTLPWTAGYSVFHAAIIQLFIHRLVQGDQQGEGASRMLLAISRSSRILQSACWKFGGLTKHTELLRHLEATLPSPVMVSMAPSL
jgi:hypothetical protein